MLAIVFVVHDGTGITVNDIGKLLLCHARIFPSFLDGYSYIPEI